MPSALEHLQTAKDNLLAKVAAVTADPKPTYSIDGQSVSYNEYYNSLLSQLTLINRLINAEAPYEHKSQMY
jgi:hypothetical protein